MRAITAVHTRFSTSAPSRLLSMFDTVTPAHHASDRIAIIVGAVAQLAACEKLVGFAVLMRVSEGPRAVTAVHSASTARIAGLTPLHQHITLLIGCHDRWRCRTASCLPEAYGLASRGCVALVKPLLLRQVVF